MPATEMVMLVAAFAALALIAIHLLRLMTTAILHRTVRRAIERDPAMAESLLVRLSSPSSSGGDDRTALLLIATGIAIVVSCLVIGDSELVRFGVAGAVFPLIIGMALWVRDYVVRRGDDAGPR